MTAPGRWLGSLLFVAAALIALGLTVFAPH